MINIVDKPVPIATPLLYPVAMLQIVDLRITCLPFLQGHAPAGQPKFNWWFDKLEAAELDRFSELVADIKADIGTGECTESKDHTNSFETTLGEEDGQKEMGPSHKASEAQFQLSGEPRCGVVIFYFSLLLISRRRCLVRLLQLTR